MKHHCQHSTPTDLWSMIIRVQHPNCVLEISRNFCALGYHSAALVIPKLPSGVVMTSKHQEFTAKQVWGNYKPPGSVMRIK